MTMACLDGRFWIKQSEDGQQFEQMAFLDVIKKEEIGGNTDENKKEVHVVRIYDFQEQKCVFKAEINWQVGDVLFTKY